MGACEGPAPILNILGPCCCCGVWGIKAGAPAGAAGAAPPKLKPEEAGAGGCAAGVAEAPKAKEGGEVAEAAKLNPPVLPPAGGWAGVPNVVACPKAGGGFVGAGAALEPNWNTPEDAGAAAAAPPVLELPKLKTPV